MRAYTPGGQGRKAQGVRHTRRGEGAPHRSPEAVEGVAVGGSRCLCRGCWRGGPRWCGVVS